MKSPFQKMLSKMLAEQDGWDILQGIDIDAPGPNDNRRIVPSADDVVNTANDTPQQNDDFNFQTPCSTQEYSSKWYSCVFKFIYVSTPS